MSLRLMRVFRSVAENKNFSRAAEQLQITRPAISQAITQLEEQLDVKLFNHTTRQVHLTPEGELYFHHAIDILERIELMEDQLKKPMSGPAGRIRIEASPFISKSFLLPHIIDFQGQYPQIEIVLATNDSQIDFKKSATDFSLQIGGEIPNNLIGHQLCDIQFVCCASPQYLAVNGEPKTINDLKKYKSVNLFSKNTGRIIPFSFIDNNNIIEINMQHDIAADDLETCLAYTLADKGIAVLPRFLIEKHIEKGDLVNILESEQLQPQPLRLLSLPAKIENHKLNLFSDWLKNLPIEA